VLPRQVLSLKQVVEPAQHAMPWLLCSNKQFETCPRLLPMHTIPAPIGIILEIPSTQKSHDSILVAETAQAEMIGLHELSEISIPAK
jgi:hypothetical protein